MQLTTLYRTSLSSAKRSYASGYAQSLQDILDVVLLRLQQPPASAPGYSAHLHHHNAVAESNREELLWLVRYLRARIEAIKAESEDDEDQESDEEVEDVQNVPASKAIRGHSAPVTIATSAPPEEVRSFDEQAITKGNDIKAEQVVAKEEVASRDEPSTSASSSIAPAVTPPSAIFSFTAPGQPAQALSIAPLVSRSLPQGVTRRKVKSIPPNHGSINMTTTTIVPAHAASSVSSEEEPLTPSKRSSGRLGKRTTGRDKANAMMSAKKRRGMGDRRDDERRDPGLH
jgi:hypothetical protein